MTLPLHLFNAFSPSLPLFLLISSVPTEFPAASFEQLNVCNHSRGGSSGGAPSALKSSLAALPPSLPAHNIIFNAGYRGGPPSLPPSLDHSSFQDGAARSPVRVATWDLLMAAATGMEFDDRPKQGYISHFVFDCHGAGHATNFLRFLSTYLWRVLW